MKTVGIVGGLGPESTIDYYRRILELWEREDPSTAPSIVIDSLDVRLALRLVDSDRSALAEYLLASLRRLAGAGVDETTIALRYAGSFGTALRPHRRVASLAPAQTVPAV